MLCNIFLSAACIKGGGLKDKQEKCGRRTHKCANKCTNRGQSGPQTDTPVCETLHFALFNKLRVNRPGSTKMLGALVGLLAFGPLAFGIAVVISTAGALVVITI